jgi:hypothetical protein
MRPVRIFVSYDRADEVAVRKLVTRLRKADHYIWNDALLRVGQHWWTEILDEIERADVVVLAVSPEMVRSEACAAERRYAAKVGRPLLPIEIVPVNKNALPPDLATIQIRGSVEELTTALRTLPQNPPLPHPMPDRPAAPLSRLATLRNRLTDEQLDQPAQFAIVAEFVLAHRSADPVERRNARHLMIDGARSPFLFQQPAELLHSELHGGPGPLAIAGAALGAVGTVSFGFTLGLYAILPRPYEVIGPNLVLTVVGALLCALALRQHRRSALLGLTICAVSLLAIVVDAIKNGAVPLP